MLVQPETGKPRCAGPSIIARPRPVPREVEDPKLLYANAAFRAISPFRVPPNPLAQRVDVFLGANCANLGEFEEGRNEILLKETRKGGTLYGAIQLEVRQIGFASIRVISVSNDALLGTKPCVRLE